MATFAYRVKPDQPGALVSVIMGSRSDWPTMVEVCKILERFEVKFEAQVHSAHRTPDRLREYVRFLSERSIRVVIAGAGGAAALPGVVAGHTSLPVIGVPIRTEFLDGFNSVLSMLHMPGGVPVPIVSPDKAGAKNAGLFAVRILGASESRFRVPYQNYIHEMEREVPIEPEDEPV